ncbi:2,5-diketo-D-gluconate reductase A [Methylobacterium sp. BE186]|uniref:aldo/keto reductase n=1 Tax=Methylobacterium sp. BE186 TaxID=2817715 RepID=UPI002863465B|nr:aldo/keto reductase [Methylobacterium sp. BE186]MDR7036168.1 2,5-diketo-D-gluconate reductase A [Methylobacterium sp. BE186]
MPVSVPTLRLNDGRAMPQLGFGVYQLPEADAPDIIGRAIGAGYRSIDTAAIYGNERGVGQAIREAGVGREDLFVTTKLWNDSQGRDAARRAFDESLTRLGLEHVDLYLIHWPCPERNLYLETWRALAALREEGRALSIGVSNFTVAQLERIIGETGIVPAINQIELHPRFQQAELRAFHEAHGIVTESWSPLGQGKELADPVLTRIAGAHRRTPAQIVLRWHLETGLVAIPKTATPARIAENIGVFDFALGEEDRRAIASLDRPDGRIGPNPDTFG